MKAKTLLLALAGAAALLALWVGGAPTATRADTGKDHTWTVSFSTTAPNAAVQTNVALVMCTGALGPNGTECAQGTSPGTPVEPFLDGATTQFTGVVPQSVAVGLEVQHINFDIQSNLIAGSSHNAVTGQPNQCNAAGTSHFALGGGQLGINMYSGVKAGAGAAVQVPTTAGQVVSMAPSTTTGWSWDQLDDVNEGNPGAPQGDGVPAGIRYLPEVIKSVQASSGIPDSAIVARNYGIASIIPNLYQTSVNFLVIGTGGSLYYNVTILGNPFGVANPLSQETLTCPPFESDVQTFATSQPALAAFISPPPSGGNAQVVAGSGGPFQYNIALSTAPDSDSDGITDQQDNCPTVPNANQADSVGNGIGDACRNGQGYPAPNPTAVANAAISCSSAGHNGNATQPPFDVCQDADQDGFLNTVDNCPFNANGVTPDIQLNSDSDALGNACDPQPTYRGDGTGYVNGALAFATVGQYHDHDDVAQVAWTLNGSLTPATAYIDNNPGSPALSSFADTNDDGVADYLVLASGGSGPTSVVRDHKADSNGDGYSDADEGTPQNCARTTGNCGSITTAGTAETATCRDTGKSCGVGVTVEPLGLRREAPGNGEGCDVSLKNPPGHNTKNLAKADVDLDGSVSILDLSKVAGWYNNSVGPSNDPRWEGNMDGDSSISILDLSAMAANYNDNVSTACHA